MPFWIKDNHGRGWHYRFDFGIWWVWNGIIYKCDIKWMYIALFFYFSLTFKIASDKLKFLVAFQFMCCKIFSSSSYILCWWDIEVKFSLAFVNFSYIFTQTPRMRSSKNCNMWCKSRAVFTPFSSLVLFFRPLIYILFNRTPPDAASEGSSWTRISTENKRIMNYM